MPEVKRTSEKESVANSLDLLVKRGYISSSLETFKDGTQSPSLRIKFPNLSHDVPHEVQAALGRVKDSGLVAKEAGENSRLKYNEASEVLGEKVDELWKKAESARSKIGSEILKMGWTGSEKRGLEITRGQYNPTSFRWYLRGEVDPEMYAKLVDEGIIVGKKMDRIDDKPFGINVILTQAGERAVGKDSQDTYRSHLV